MCSRYFNYKLGKDGEESSEKNNQEGEKPFSARRIFLLPSLSFPLLSRMTGNVMQQEEFIELGPLKVTSSLEVLPPTSMIRSALDEDPLMHKAHYFHYTSRFLFCSAAVLISLFYFFLFLFGIKRQRIIFGPANGGKKSIH